MNTYILFLICMALIYDVFIFFYIFPIEGNRESIKITSSLQRQATHFLLTFNSFLSSIPRVYHNHTPHTTLPRLCLFYFICLLKTQRTMKSKQTK